MNNFPLLQATDSNGNTLLHLAATDNNYQLVKFLIMRGVNLTALNNNVETALTISEMENNQAISNILKQAGAR
jgi:ankyrin repeat protein